MHHTNKTLSISILSGKGGVGKTNIALNTAYALHNAGHNLLLMDCDLGLANLDVLLGISPQHTLLDLLKSDAVPRQIVMKLEHNLDFLPAATGLPELVELDEDLQSVLLHKLIALCRPYHFLFLDLGAGINPTVLSFASMSVQKLVVITPEPTSLTDSYALIKIMSSRYDCKEFDVVVNMVDNQTEARKAFERLNGACLKFLGFGLTYLGSIRNDKAVHEAVRNQVPLVKQAPRSDAGHDIIGLAAKLHKTRHRLLSTLAGQPALSSLTRF
ncbi:MAG: MinD/ParA family protein [Desulfovibrionales bacterium]